MKTDTAEAAANRVAIAEDVLKHLASGLIIPEEGSYCGMMGEDDLLITFKQGDVGRDVREMLGNEIAACEVCAKGALFIGHVMKFDGLKLHRMAPKLGGSVYQSEESVCKPLMENFSQDQLDLIEQAFEGFDDGPHVARLFYGMYGTAYRRLSAICQNIIANGGTFKP